MYGPYSRSKWVKVCGQANLFEVEINKVRAARNLQITFGQQTKLTKYLCLPRCLARKFTCQTCCRRDSSSLGFCERRFTTCTIKIARHSMYPLIYIYMYKWICSHALWLRIRLSCQVKCPIEPCLSSNSASSSRASSSNFVAHFVSH